MISVRLSVGDVYATVEADCPYAPDLVDDMCAQARRSLLALWAQLQDETAEPTEQEAPWLTAPGT